MKLISKMTRYAFPAVVLLSVMIAGQDAAHAQGQPLYLDDNQPVENRIADLLPRLTLEEKVSLVHADSVFTTAGIPRLGIPPLRMDDGPLGVRADVGEHFETLNRTDDYATGMPASLGLAAAWNTDLARDYGTVIGQEAKQRGKDIMLGPSLCIMRTPLCGRNFEYMGEDPFLTGCIGANYIQGEQAQGVSSCAKHFAANSQEFERGSINEIIDERTLREIYLPAFKAAVQQGGVLAVMGAYNQVNGQYCSENQHLLNDILEGDWGFQGVTISDWGAVHHTIPAALHGVDIEMGSSQPYDNYYLANPFLAALQSGQVPMSALDDKVRRHLYVMFKLNLVHDPALALTNAAPSTPISTPAHQEIARTVAAESMVLLKNKNVLPLNPAGIKKIAIIGGNAAMDFCSGGGSAAIKAPYEITALAGISNYLGGKVEITYSEGYRPPVNRAWGKPISLAETQQTDSNLVAEAVATARSADVVIYVGGLDHAIGIDSESQDRLNLKLPAGQDALLWKIVDANPRTVVVLYGGGPVEMDRAWLSHVPALIYAWYPGMEGGHALAQVLFGDVNPSGKLPCTFPRKLADTPAAALDAYPGTNGTVIYKEGLLVGYRWYDSKKIEPLFPFGFGLSYTTFKYSHLKLIEGPGTNNPPLTVQFDLTDTGARAGAEVAEIYVQPVHPDVFRPVRELKGFQKIFLQPGETRQVSVPLDRDAFAYYNVDQKGWVAQKGGYKILIGGSSRDLRLKGNFILPETIAWR